MGDSINVLLDDIWAFLTRILSMPIAFQFSLWIIVNLIFWLITFKLMGFIKKPIELSAKRWIFITSFIISILTGVSVALDHKNYLIELNSAMNNQQNLNFIMHSNEGLKEDTNKKLFLASKFNIIKDEFTSVNSIYKDESIEIIRISIKEPIAVAHIAELNLNKLDVVLDTAISSKELTSTFAKRFNVDIAVNGEAGTTPGFSAPLGQWIGYYVVNGSVILNKDSKIRPFIYFNKESRGYYSPENELITSLSSNYHNVIWGRFDLLRKGKLCISPRDGTKNNPYPRTIVGIDSTGQKAFLMIADGRKPTYSMGMTMEQCGKLLLEAGCYDAMACDQGGSSVMYLKSYGLISRPADGGERVVYTHLGFRKKN